MWRRQLRALVLPGRAHVLSLGPHATDWARDDSVLDQSRRPRQGRLGDCWVIAGLLAVHHAAPVRIAEMVQVLPEGDAEVRLRGGALRVRMDRRMPVAADGSWVYATESRRRVPGWVGLVEKAAAQEVAGSYGLLARGPGRFGLDLLTGERVRMHLDLPEATELNRWVHAGHAVLASTHPLSGQVRTMHGALPSNHVMAVVGADPGSGHVHLRNPWRPERVLTVDARTFRRGFLSVERTAEALR